MGIVRKVKNLIHLFESHFYSILYGYPIKRLKIIFVTGSDGKTTTSYFIYNVLNTNGIKTALVSTVEARIGNKTLDTGLHTTTPSKAELQKILREIVKENCQYVVFEITSHGIDQHRIVGVRPIASVFTNITKEHLDYFKTYERLVATKAKIIPIAKKAYLNKYADITPKLVEIAKDANVEYVLYDREYIREKLTDKFKKKFPGDYNLENSSAALTLALDLGVNEEGILSALEDSTPPSGRFCYIQNDREFDVVLDFAHTAKALEEVLKATKEKTKGSVIVVFGSAGDRDKQKRPFMGEAAGKFADLVVLTAEDPRTENVEDICEEIAVGLDKVGKVRDKDYFMRYDRQEAISYAINVVAKPGDLVIITGKGHEKSMCFGDVEHPWSDEDAIHKALELESAS